MRPRIRKYDDLAREFSKAARRREQPARDADHRDHPASARESYFTAAVFYGAAQWAIEANTQFNLLLDEAARLTGLSRDLLYDEMRRGNLPYVKVGRRRLITRQHLQQFLGVAS